MRRTDNVDNQKRAYFIGGLAVAVVVALFIYLVCTGTSRNGNDAKDAVRDTQEYSKQSADAVRSAGKQIKSAGEQLDRSVSRVDRAAESADRVQKRIDENSRTIAECRDLIADGRKEFDEAADIFRQVDEENR